MNNPRFRRRKTKTVTIALSLVVVACSSTKMQGSNDTSELIRPLVGVTRDRAGDRNEKEATQSNALADRLRQLYFAYEYPACVAEGQQINSSEVLAQPYRAMGWWYLCRSKVEPASEVIADALVQTQIKDENRNKFPRQDESVLRSEIAKSQLWAKFARTAAWLSDRRYGNELAEEIQDLEPKISSHPDLEWVYAYALAQLYSMDQAMPLLEGIVEAAVAERRETAPLLEILARMKAGTYQWLEPNNTQLREQALKLYARATKLDPRVLDLYLKPIECFLRPEDAGMRKMWLEQALAVAPESLAVKSRYWDALLKRPDFPQSEGHANLESELERYLKWFKHRQDASRSESQRSVEQARAFYVIGQFYQKLGLSHQRERLHRIVLEQFPHSLEAERIAYQQLESLPDVRSQNSENASGKDADKSEILRDYQSKLLDFINRPVHFNRDQLASVYTDLLLSYAPRLFNEFVNPIYLLDLAHQAVQHQSIANPHIVFGTVPIFLAEHTPFRKEAREIADQGLKQLSARETIIRALFPRASDGQQKVDRYRSAIYDAIGWTYVQEGRLEEAKSSINQALRLHPKSIGINLHMAKLEEQSGQKKEAERRLIRCLEYQFGAEINPCEVELKRIFHSRGGKAANFDRYLQYARIEYRRQKKRKVLASKKSNPSKAPKIGLVDMHGNPFAYPDLLGKVTVVHFWGVW